MEIKFLDYCKDVWIESYAPSSLANPKKTPKRIVDKIKKVIEHIYQKYNKQIDYSCELGDFKTHQFHICLS
jgi:hypothetical protein